MRFTVKKGKHRARPLRLGFWFKRKRWEWYIRFGVNWDYTLPYPDNLDLNKIIGVGFARYVGGILLGWGWLIWLIEGKRPPHHVESVRLTCNWNATINKLDLYLYTYIKSVRANRYLCSVERGQPFTFALELSDGLYLVKLRDVFTGQTLATYELPYFHRRAWSYRLGTFFGGNMAAPQDLDVDIKAI